MRENREVNANATWRALICDRPRGDMAYKETETDVLYGVAIDRARWWRRIRGLILTYYMAWRHDRAVMAYKGTETDVLYGVEMACRADATARSLLTRGFTF
jgi:hypothetical protein